MLVYSENITPRLIYVVHFVTGNFLDTVAEITSDKEYFLKAEGPKFSYCSERLGDELNIIPSGLLSENSIRNIRPETGKWKNLATIFPVSDASDVPFDLFAAVFYLLSRYEEYLPSEKDKYGRFKAEASIAFKNGFLEQAIVDRWILTFTDILKNKYPAINLPVKDFIFIPTVDVDLPYEFLYKGTIRCLGGAIKSILMGEFSELRERYEVVTRKREDPFYSFSKIMEIHKKPGLITFFLTAGYGKYDKGIDPSLEAFREMVNDISFFSFIGIHPSWASNKRPTLLEKEIRTLGDIASRSITRSRQHYLIIDLPHTFQRLSANGIKEDYSMGYASRVGFRAGTCTPFNFYDLTKEAESQLVIYPFQVMDRTLKDYMKLQPSEATMKIIELVREVRAVNGTFISIWHNDTFSEKGEWNGWLEVYEQLLEII